MKKTLLVTFASLLLASSLAQANLIQNGSFELGDFGNPGPYGKSLLPGATNIANWTIINAEVSWEDSRAGYAIASDGYRWLDLTGYHDSAPYGGVQQTITTTPGERYLLKFDIGQNVEFGVYESVLASAGDTSNTYTRTFIQPGSSYQTYEMIFTALDATTQVSLLGASPSGVGLNIDNVSVEAVPEPGSFVLIGVGTVGLALFRRRAS